MDDKADGDAGAIERCAGAAQAHIVHLRPQSEVREKTDVYAPADAEGELVRGGNTAARAEARATNQSLGKRIEIGRIVQSKPRTEKISVGVEGNTAGRSVIGAEITDDAQKVVRIKSDRAADAVLVEAAGIAQAEIGITDRNVGGLRAR